MPCHLFHGRHNILIATSTIMCAVGLFFSPSLIKSVFAQEKLPIRVGIIASGGSDQRNNPYWICFRKKLETIGQTLGHDFYLDFKFADGDKNKLPILVDELVETGAKVIVTASTFVTQIAAAKERQIPIVFGAVSDPVASGIVGSLARPSANVTGVSNNLTSSTRKILEYIKAIGPHVKKVAVLRDQKNDGKLLEQNEIFDVASSLGLRIFTIDLSAISDKNDAFLQIAALKPEALIVLHDLAVAKLKKDISDLAVKNGMILAGQLREYPESGALFSYGLNYCQHFEQVAMYVGKILRGTQPQDLPVEMPTVFELVINLNTAKYINIDISLSIIAAADIIIE